MSLMCFILFLSIFVFATETARVNFTCPYSYGFFPDPYQCDKYYECRKGKPKLRMCGDGLLFSSKSPLYEYCDYPFQVDCGNRKERQEPYVTPHCPHKFGLFPHEDPKNCSYFWMCVDGQPKSLTCQPGLAFNPKTGTCQWPNLVKTCKIHRHISYGFRCPKETPLHLQVFAQAPRYPHPTDCNKYFICLYSFEVRMMACPKGKVYNSVTLQCDKPSNVPECVGFYKRTLPYKDTINKNRAPLYLL